VEKRLFGEIAVEKGYLSREQLNEALREQERICREENTYHFIGEVFVMMGLMTEKQVLDVLSVLHEQHPTR